MVSLLTAPVYTLKITLLGTAPPVWRRIVIRGDVGLDDLHYVIQIAMDWTNSHLHQYFVGKVRIGEPGTDFEDEVKDETDFTLADVAPKKGSKFRYEYDFGDSWMHEIKVEEIEKDAGDHRYPVCIDGARNCPPEDVGGIWGYSELVAAMADPKHKRRKEFIEWLGEPFNAEAVDLKKANEQFKRFKYSR